MATNYFCVVIISSFILFALDFSSTQITDPVTLVMRGIVYYENQTLEPTCQLKLPSEDCIFSLMLTDVPIPQFNPNNTVFTQSGCTKVGSFTPVRYPGPGIQRFNISSTCDQSIMEGSLVTIQLRGLAKRQMDGSYIRCKAFVCYEWKYSAKLTIRVYVPPAHLSQEFTYGDGKSNVPEVGKTVKVVCKSENSYPLSVYKYGVIANGQEKDITSTGGIFTIAKEHMNGYQLKCTDTMHTTWTKIEDIEILSAQMLPYYLQKDKSVSEAKQFYSSSTNDLNCGVRGQPANKISYQWKVNGELRKEQLSTLTLFPLNDTIQNLNKWTISCTASLEAIRKSVTVVHNITWVRPMSTGAIVGVAVGVLLVVCAAVFFLILINKKYSLFNYVNPNWLNSINPSAVAQRDMPKPADLGTTVSGNVKHRIRRKSSKRASALASDSQKGLLVKKRRTR